MAYLFWAYALVWIALFFYLYGLARRGRALERQVAELLARSRAEPPAAGRPRGAGPS